MSAGFFFGRPVWITAWRDRAMVAATNAATSADGSGSCPPKTRTNANWDGPTKHIVRLQGCGFQLVAFTPLGRAEAVNIAVLVTRPKSRRRGNAAPPKLGSPASGMTVCRNFPSSAARPSGRRGWRLNDPRRIGGRRSAVTGGPTARPIPAWGEAPGIRAHQQPRPAGP